jgi:hypothetical protein
LGEDVWHEVTMTLYYALEAIQAKRV